MENPSTYFTRRAGQERARAAEAVSAEARTAHIELAFRLVNLATDPATWRASEEGPNATPAGAAARQTAVSRSEVGKALVDAFALPTAGAFANLLQAINEPAVHDAGASNVRRK